MLEFGVSRHVGFFSILPGLYPLSTQVHFCDFSFKKSLPINHTYKFSINYQINHILYPIFLSSSTTPQKWLPQKIIFVRTGCFTEGWPIEANAGAPPVRWPCSWSCTTTTRWNRGSSFALRWTRRRNSAYLETGGQGTFLGQTIANFRNIADLDLGNKKLPNSDSVH